MGFFDSYHADESTRVGFSHLNGISELAQKLLAAGNLYTCLVSENIARCRHHDHYKSFSATSQECSMQHNGDEWLNDYFMNYAAFEILIQF